MTPLSPDQLRALREKADEEPASAFLKRLHDAIPEHLRGWSVGVTPTMGDLLFTVEYGDNPAQTYDLFEDPPEAVVRFVVACERRLPALLEEVERRGERIERLEEALRPFVYFADFLEGMRELFSPSGPIPEEMVIARVLNQSGQTIQWRDLLEARAALAGDAEKGVGEDG